MSKHTPGPWELWTSCSFRRFGSDHGMVCEPITQNDGHPDLYFRNGGPEGPDARLIAAAPDLLNALRSVLGWWDESGPGDMLPIALEAEARAAIAKAEGES